jgi:ubiquinone/menaquinone biosynthesis C-methylase UbiE
MITHRNKRKNASMKGNNTAWQRIIRFGFRLLYNEMAWSYDAVSWIVSLGHWREWQGAAIPYLSGGSVLEIAHGPGHILLAINSAGFKVMGLDSSAYMGKQARRRIEKRGVRIPVVRGRAQNLPYRSGAFDNVLMTFPTSFVIDPDTTKGIYRILKAGGCLVIIPEARLTGQGPIYRFIEWLFVITGQRHKASAEKEPQSPWRELIKLLEEAGFNIAVHRVSQEKSDVIVIAAEKSLWVQNG